MRGKTSPKLDSLSRMTTATGDKINYTYDGLKRLSGTTVKNADESATLFETSYGYKANGSNTTPLVETYTVQTGTTELAGYTYTYDELGNITQISTSAGTNYPLVKYTYDALNQLLSETYYDGEGNTSSNITAVYTYTYDTAGNLLTKSDGTDTVPYTYGNSEWRDLLTAYDGGKIAYEGQAYTVSTKLGLTTYVVTGTATSGNPVSYYNGTRWDMEWEQGRNLAESASESSNTTVTSAARVDTVNTLNYSYDPDGIRAGKTTVVKTYKYRASTGGGAVVASVDGGVSDPEAVSYIRYLYSTVTTSHDYVTQNGKVVRETITQGTTTRILDFIYDESGRPFAMRYSPNGGTTFGIYYYVLNLQGDVVKLITSGGTVIANYEYNAWGELLSVTNASGTAITSSTHIANLNPLRYRGYYYDTETGFYYLQSRYYDPVTHRFINADSYASTGQGLLGHNMFAYCRNNPVTRKDVTGFCDKTDEDCDGDIYEIEQYGGGGGSSGYIYGGDGWYTTSSYGTSGYTSNGYYSSSVSYTHTTNGSTTSTSTSSTYTGSYGYSSSYYSSYNIGNLGNRFSCDQQALLDIVKQGCKSGFSMNDAKLISEWGKEYGFENARIDTGHSNGKNAVTRGPHLHIGPYNHIRIFGLK